MLFPQTDPLESNTAPQVLLAGLDAKLTEELSGHLRSRGLRVRSCDKLDCFQTEMQEDCALAFCDITQSGLAAMLRAISIPVVVVSRLPEVNDWLDAMDAGAVDYCAAPIEERELEWILESNLNREKSAPAAA
jgi:DNA-binding response OmpR family regulator